MSHARARGFTLVEVLVALTVMGVLMAGLFGVLQFGARSWETGSARAEQVEDLQILHGFLRRRLGAMMLPVSDAESLALEADEPLLGGGAERLRFLSTLPAEIGMGGVYLFDLHLSRDETVDLVLDWYVYRPEGLYPPVDRAEQGRILLSGLENLKFQYLVLDDTGENLLWAEEWSPERGLPTAVRVDMAFPAGDPRRWPGLTAVLHSAKR